MKKKDYERPTMQVVQLKQQPTLLAGSLNATGDTQLQDYTVDDLLDL